ncbi:MAG: carbohydrate ABC transporter permease [Thermoflexales bacterium]|nr:carbohydrate ABC transporter permease [Thermoflexales bacterium]
MTRQPLLSRKLRSALGTGLLQLVMTIAVISFLVPTFWMVSSSLKASTEIFASPIVWIPKQPMWRNYADVFNSPALPMLRFAFNTLFITALAVLGAVISSALVGYSLARIKFPGRDVIFAMVMATTLLPEIVMLIPRFIIFRNLPMFGADDALQISKSLLNVLPWLDRPTWLDTPLPLIVPYWLAGTGLYVFLMRQFFRGIPMELEEAAVMDGASRWQIFWRILMPLAKPATVSVAVFALFQHYNSYLEPVIFLNNKDNWTLAMALRAFNDTYASQWELVFAAATIMVIPMVILFIVAQRYFVEGIATTGFGGR